MDNVPFTVTLPSNSNMKTYPKNRGHKYTVKLSAPLNFSGQTLNEDDSWEAALTSVQYTNRFYDVRENATMRVLVKIPNMSYVDVKSPTVLGAKQVSDSITRRQIETNFNELDAIALVAFAKDPNIPAHVADRSFIVISNITIPAGHYKSPSDVCNLFVAEFNRLYGGPRFNVRLSITVKDGMLQFQLDNKDYKLYMFTDKPSIINMFGLKGTVAEVDREDFWLLDTVGTKTPRFDSVQSLYMYCDIIKPQHVGDTLAPLMEVVPVQGLPGQRVHYNVNPSTYLPVNRTFVETISVEICDEYGNPVAFPDDVENVVCRLRFRRRKQGALML